MGPSRPQKIALACAAAIVGIVTAALVANQMLTRAPADALATDAFATAAAFALAAVAIAGFAAVPVRQRLGLVPSGLGLARIAIGAIGLAALSHAADGVVELAGFPSGGLARIDDALAELRLDRVAYPLLGLAVAPALGEELFFRGLLQRGLAPRIGRAVAIAVASLAFGAAHGDWTYGGVTTVLGLYLGVVAARTGSIVPSIAAHAFNNGLAVVEKPLGLAQPGGPIATPLGIAVSAAIAAVALRFAVAPAAPIHALQPPPGCTDEPGDA